MKYVSEYASLRQLVFSKILSRSFSIASNEIVATLMPISTWELCNSNHTLPDSRQTYVGSITEKRSKRWLKRLRKRKRVGDRETNTAAIYIAGLRLISAFALSITQTCGEWGVESRESRDRRTFKWCVEWLVTHGYGMDTYTVVTCKWMSHKLPTDKRTVESFVCHMGQSAALVV